MVLQLQKHIYSFNRICHLRLLQSKIQTQKKLALILALQASQDELSVIREKAVGTLGEEAAQVFDAHLMVLADPEMISQIKETIRAKKVNAEAGLKEVTDMFITIFEGMEDNPYMQERASRISAT